MTERLPIALLYLVCWLVVAASGIGGWLAGRAVDSDGGADGSSTDVLGGSATTSSTIATTITPNAPHHHP